MKNSKTLASVLVTAAATLALTACGTHDTSTKPTTTQSAARDHNRADVDFARRMIPHHQQALRMVAMTTGHELSPEMKQLADDIKAAQGPEIELMKAWLQQWGEPVPGTSDSNGMSHMNGAEGMHPDGSETSDMQGMMSDEDLGQLRFARGQDFESMWLRMMIKHHEGAIEMATYEQKHGSYAPALKLAASIATSQQKEIDHMTDLLKSS